jgi:ribosomal protein S18 acetylase RimI-like enzyme
MLTEVFISNPAYSIVFQKKNRKEEGLRWLFKASLKLNNHKHTLTYVIKEEETKKIIGTYTLIPPQGLKNGIAIYLKIGIPAFISKFGLQAFIRMLSLDDYNKSVLRKSIKATEYYYLSMVAVREEYRGRGIGSDAIQYAISELMASNPTCNLIGLTTQLPENVTFYSRLGFEKIDEGLVNFKGDSYYNYNMKLTL